LGLLRHEIIRIPAERWHDPVYTDISIHEDVSKNKGFERIMTLHLRYCDWSMKKRRKEPVVA
jgi:hypothetical protein